MKFRTPLLVWRSRGATCCLMVCIVLAWGVRPGLARSEDVFWPAPPLTGLMREDTDPAIEWQEDWRKTVDHQRKIWDQQLESEDKETRDRRMHARMVALLRACIDHFPRERDLHLRARFEIADRLGKLDARTRQMIELRGIIEDHPGNFDAALDALRQMLSASGDDHLQQRDVWMQFAVRRLAALGDGGYLLPGDQRIVSGFFALSKLRREQLRFAEAADALREVEARRGRTYDVVREEVELLIAAGRRDLARQRMEELRPLIPSDKSGRQVRERLEKSLGAEGRGQITSVLTDVILEGRYDVLNRAGKNVDAATVQSVLDNPQATEGLVSVGPGRLASAWHATVRLVQARAPDVAQTLKDQHKDRAAAAASTSDGDEAALLAAFRRFPWSPAIHEAMVAAGERALWRGDFGAAYRWFQDASDLTVNADLRDRARVGAWMALAQTGLVYTLDQTLMGELETGRSYPWIGGSALSGADLQRQLQAATQQAAEQSAGGWSIQWLDVPAVDGWQPVLNGNMTIAQQDQAPHVAPRPIAGERAMNFVAGLTFVAGYAPGQSAALWTRTAPPAAASDTEDRRGISPSAVGGAVADGSLFTRWAPDAGGVPTTVAAFDTRSGDLLWSAAGNADWGNLHPVSDPVVVDGQVVVVAITGGLLATAHVVSLDAISGDVLWRQSLGTQTLEMQLSWNRDLDVAHFGNAVTADRGSIYVATNLGSVARLDQRDGAVEWLTLYPRSDPDRYGHPLLGRRGAPPAVIGDHVIFIPRDRQGVLALDRRTGAIAWERPLAASQGLVGGAGGAAVVFDDHTLVALDAATGETRWRRQLTRRLSAPPLMTADAIYAATPDELLRIDPDNGRIRESRPLTRPVASLRAARGSLLAVAGGSSDRMPPALGGERLRVAPGQDRLANPPWGVRLHLDRAHAKVIVPPQGVWTASAILLQSGQVLEAIDLSADQPVLWRRALSREDVQFAWSAAGGGTLLILQRHDLQAVSLHDGATRWRAAVEGIGTGIAVSDRQVAVATLDVQSDLYLAMFDLRSGHLQWQRTLGGSATVTALALRDEALVLAGIVGWEHRSGRWLVDPRDGAVLSSDRPTGDRKRIEHLEAVGDQLVISTSDYYWGAAPLTSGQVASDPPKFDMGKYSHTRIIEEGPGWVRGDDRSRRDGRVLFVSPQHPTKIIETLSHGAVVRGRWVLWPKGQTVQVFEAGDTQPDSTLTLPEPAKGLKLIPVTAALDPAAERIVVASKVSRPMTGRAAASQLRLDVFERSSGKHLGGQVLPNIAVFGEDHRERTGALLPADLDVVWDEAGLVVVGPYGVDLVASVDAAASEVIDLAASAPLADFEVDGHLSEWNDVEARRMMGPDGDGSIRLAHNPGRLLIAVTHPQPAAAPYAADGLVATGSRLEIGITGGPQPIHFAFGLDADGRITRHSLRADALPDGVRLAARYDAADGVLCYEVAIPLSRPHDRESVGVSLAAWRGGTLEAEAERYLFGNGLSTGGIRREGHRPVSLPAAE